MNENKHSVFDSLSSFVFQILIFLVPVFFVPSSSVPFNTAKSPLIIVGSLLLLVFFLAGRMKEGKFSFPKIWAYGSALILLAAYALAAFFSGNIGLSIFGGGLDQGSLAFMTAVIVLFLLTPLIVDSEAKVFRSYKTLLASFLLLAFWEVIHFVFPGLSFGVFTSPTVNMVGTWNDLAVFFGLALILSVITLEKIPLQKFGRICVYISIAVSSIFLILINFSETWFILALFGLLYLIYGISSNRNNPEKKFPIFASVILGVSLIFIFFGTPLGNAISGVSQVSLS